jgi:hypothetical protein
MSDPSIASEAPGQGPLGRSPRRRLQFGLRTVVGLTALGAGGIVARR